ncbi:hypothetical protein VTH82DRAFT_6798 [Thermothelomyces myriococcoides]
MLLLPPKPEPKPIFDGQDYHGADPQTRSAFFRLPVTIREEILRIHFGDRTIHLIILPKSYQWAGFFCSHGRNSDLRRLNRTGFRCSFDNGCWDRHGGWCCWVQEKDVYALKLGNPGVINGIFEVM